jgi:DNA-binding GntR family transcriptional regulator
MRMVASAELQDRAYHSIRRKIVEGRVRSRKDLSRRVLQAELGVSSTCIQVALARLEGERLLESRPQSGTFLRQIDFKEYCEHYEIRECLEPQAARLAARRITPAQLKQIQKSCVAYADVEDYWKNGPAEMNDAILDRTVAAEHVFHSTIMEAAGNATAAHIIENLRVEHYNRLMNMPLPPAIILNLVELTVKEHVGIFRALKAGDPANAERRMRRHLHRACLYVKNLERK